MPSDSEIRKILQQPGLSEWFKAALSSALERDPVEAANEAGLLAIVLDRRSQEIVAEAIAIDAIESVRGKI